MPEPAFNAGLMDGESAEPMPASDAGARDEGSAALTHGAPDKDGLAETAARSGREVVARGHELTAHGNGGEGMPAFNAGLMDEGSAEPMPGSDPDTKEEKAAFPILHAWRMQRRKCRMGQAAYHAGQ